MVIRGATSSSTLPIDWSAIQSSQLFPSLPQPLAFGFDGLDLEEQLEELPEEQKKRLREFVGANQDQFGPTIDTPVELRQLLQQLNQGEGRAHGLQKLDAPRGGQLENMSASEMLQLLIDYFANGGAEERNRPRNLGNLSGGGSPSFGGGGGGSGGGGGGGGGSGGVSSSGGSGGPSSAPVGPATNTGSLRGNTNAEKAFNYFVEKGLTKEQAAGIVGNLMQESGVDPNSDQAGGPGRGIAQWSEGERWNGVLALAQQQGKSPNDLGVQLDYIWQELNSTESAALSALRGANTAADAAVIFEEKFERAGIPNNEARIRYANDALAQFA